MNLALFIVPLRSELRSVLLLMAPVLVAASGLAAVSDSPCVDTARAIRKAAREEANAAYWIDIANCTNESDDDDVEDCVRSAWEDRLDALALAQEQFLARVQVCDLLGGGLYDPDLDEDEFSEDVTNPYFPLVPGRTLVYENASHEKHERVEITTLRQTNSIDDVVSRAVRDRVTVDGVVVEDTIDWFAQHEDGTVWYMGEISQNFEDGLLDNLDGSWRAGKDEAEPGIQMLGNPSVGTVYRQEFLVNEAEDVARVLSLGETVVVPAGTFTNCVRIEEWTPLSPGGIEWKYYAPGIGLVLELNPASGERLELIRVVD